MAKSPEAAGPFTHPPLLPVVPPPVAGETLSGWVTALGEIYGLTAAGLLRTMGVAAPKRLRWLDITPASDVLTALSAQTGVGVAFMLTRMTFYGLDRELVPRVLAAVPRCAAGCDGTGRKVERLSTIAPWVFACDRHATAIIADELDAALDGAAMPRDLARFSACLDSAACREVSRPFAAIERSTAECLRLVDAINERSACGCAPDPTARRHSTSPNRKMLRTASSPRSSATAGRCRPGMPGTSPAASTGHCSGPRASTTARSCEAW